MGKVLHNGVVIRKFDRKALGIMTGNAKCDGKLSKSVTGITKCKNYYKVRCNRLPGCKSNMFILISLSIILNELYTTKMNVFLPHFVNTLFMALYKAFPKTTYTIFTAFVVLFVKLSIVVTLQNFFVNLGSQ